MTAIVTRGDAAHLHLPDETVDLIVTSPPYFALRSYTDGGEHYEGQVGDEATPTEYLDALIACTREWMRVLKPGGSIFVNLGDKYSQSASQGQGSRRGHNGMLAGTKADAAARFGQGAWSDAPAMGKPKSLIGLPWRYAIRCVDELGLILRAEIVWAKPNGLPESVTDRVRRSHEQVFHFVKQPRYYSAIDEVREAHAGEFLSSGVRNPRYGRPGGQMPGRAAGVGEGRGAIVNGKPGNEFTAPLNPLGKLPGSVWEIPTAKLAVPDHLGVDHFAAYPPELVRRIVLGWSPRDVCTACGEGRRPVSDFEQVLVQKTYNGRALTEVGREDCRSGPPRVTLRTIIGYVCACPDTTAPTTPGVVLDPFGGTGTTALVASAYGRVGISVDLSADYCRLAQWRTTDPGERARVLGVPKPEPVPDAQLGLFEGLTGGAR